ncbi:MAG: DUF1385 domain-containing protein [Coriobacteriia bacterium]|nr:DUF1385 domain-containing protein [Coriobacteriia bacterium]MBS5477379.1 DUF1385 domain-containing protein [Coriobacteriia bacterium]
MKTTTDREARAACGAKKMNHDHADELFQSHIGGAAMLEGVMMRGRYSWAVAVREPEGGIYLEEHDVPGYGKKQSWRRWPLVRGCVSLVESLVLQFKAMAIVADHAYDFSEDEDTDASQGAQKNPQCSNLLSDKGNDPTGGEQRGDVPRAQFRSAQPQGARDEDCLSTEEHPHDATEPEEGGIAGWMGVSMLIGVVLGVALFIFVPAFVTNLIVGDYSSQNMVAWNIVDGILRAGIFVLYMWLISLMPDIKRMFGYHGAEHKTIHCLEHGLPLTPENARRFSRQHVRCGTAFIIMTLIVSIIVFTVFPTDLIASAMGLGEGIGRFLVVLLSRIVLIPVVAGLSYEITVRWAGSHPENPLVKVVLAPGMAMQLITTNEPDDSMLECAIASMKAVIAREAAEEGRELDADGLPVDRAALEGCPLDPAAGHGRRAAAAE